MVLTMEESFYTSIYESNAHADVKILFALYNKQPLKITEIADATGVKRPTVSKRTNILEDIGLLENLNPKKGKHGAAKIYILWNYIGLKDIFDILKERNIEKISLRQLGNKIGKDPEEIRSRAFELAGEYSIKIVKDEDAIKNLEQRLYGHSALDYFE